MAPDTATAAPPPRRRRWLRGALLAIVGAASVFLYETALPQPTSATGGFTATGDRIKPSPPVPLRVATFNIAGGAGADGKSELTRTAAALKGFDLIGLEEVHGTSRAHNNAATLADVDGLSWLYAPAEHQWWGLKWFGNGLLSDLPVEQWASVPISTARSKTNRNLILARAGYQGQPIRILVTHLDRHEDHDAELQTVIAIFDDLKSPAILLGDLNTPASDPQLHALDVEAGVVNCLRVGTGANVPADNVDWIFAKGFRCTAAGFSDNGASDHHLAWAELVLPEDAPPTGAAAATPRTSSPSSGTPGEGRGGGSAK